MATKTWQDRELRILDHVVTAWRDAGHDVDSDGIARAVGLDEDVVRDLDMLREGGYIKGEYMIGSPGRMMFIVPTPKALEALGVWPTPGAELYDRLLEVLDERIAVEPDEHKLTHLRRLRQVLVDAGPSLVAGALLEAAKLAAGLGI